MVNKPLVADSSLVAEGYACPAGSYIAGVNIYNCESSICKYNYKCLPCTSNCKRCIGP